ncbi:hypothetical protein BO94DRAFT_357902 [Aspergillus sclerotioniger CBS 115572]|uniref:BZIP domain-containing protein n=1 Tax=Aspergillus sclerotioniger CBS 115572 TaxID=1450535 RepID=A0A317X7W0_9EURO|nr:hypothetical protein BO94DRAFT_357902 [Aspergillus sclerotioniger CBS 115572]PWY92988.1 hypothetical protein BO94DRAFT_357902 [Aspergillus sclerotioniger CBS 115572]
MADVKMSANLNLCGPLSGPPAIIGPDETWPDSLPFFMDTTIPPEYLSLPMLQENNNPWLFNGNASANAFSPPVTWPACPAPRTDSTASSEASFIAPCQTIHRPSDDDRKYSTAQTFTFAPSQIPTPMHEITSRGSISSTQSRFSISSYSSADSPSHSRRGSSQRPASPGFQHDDRERRKRERFLERNRVAANKCRKKKKEHAKQLESRCETVSRQNTLLESEVDHLKGEILSLKNELLRHSQCGDDGIKRHLARMVKQISHRSTTAGDRRTDDLSRTGSPNKEHGLPFEFQDVLHLEGSGGGGPVEQERIDPD